MWGRHSCLPPAFSRRAAVRGTRRFRLVCPAAFACIALAAAPISIEYPADGSVFPPEITAPAFLWHDSASAAWTIDVEFHDGAASIHARANAPAWVPDAAIWEQIKKHSVEGPATITITGTARNARARVSIHTSKDPVGAPIFYRDVPLMPSEVEKGVIKPLAPAAIPLIAWRLRNVEEPRSRLILEGLHTCTNCHSFSRDGKTMGMDVDGPENDKGTYAIAAVAPQMTIANRDVITWNDFANKPEGSHTIGFLSQISPDGRYAVTTLNEAVYVANFKDYGFLQVFYPTRGILAWYNRATREMKALPGADDPRYVHTDAVWSPDGKYLVFARAEAKDPYPPGRKPAEFANDPNETPIQYDLYRIPFNEGKGGRAEPIAGASRNGMSNNFPKVSPNGRWIVYVECRNGQLMRPDSVLYIVPAEGGTPRRMRANTALMNSWHSFSPNGRWMVFSSKSWSPYTQMFLTHVDEEGNDSPPVLIENATAADRAVNIPEFLNIPQDGLLHIDMPAAEFYRLFDSALDLEQKGRHGAAVAEWRKALSMDSQNAKAHTNLGIALWGTGARAEAIAEFRRAVELKSDYAEAHNNLGVALVQTGGFAEAVAHFRAVLQVKPDSAEAHNNLGVALLGTGRFAEAAAHFQKVLEANPNNVAVLNQTAWLLATCRDAAIRNGAAALKLAERAQQLSGGQDPAILDTLAAAYAESGRFAAAMETARRALALATSHNDPPLAQALKSRMVLYEAKTAYREK